MLMVSGQPRNFTIDVLRGTSICLVLLLHFHLSYSLLDSPLALVLPERAIKALVPLHSGFDGLSVSGIERGQVGAVHLDGDAPSCAGVA